MQKLKLNKVQKGCQRGGLLIISTVIITILKEVSISGLEVKLDPSPIAS